MSTVINFADLHSPDAEARTRQDIVHSLHEAIKNTEQGLELLPTRIFMAFDHRVWEQVRIFAGGTRKGPTSFDEFVTAPYPVGLGSSVVAIKDLLSKSLKVENATRAANMIDEARKANSHPGERNDLVDISNKVKRPTGTTVDAGLRRLRKEVASGNGRAASLLDEVLAEQISVNSALIHLGIRKRTITVRDEPEAIAALAIDRTGALATAQRAWGRMTAEERDRFDLWKAGQEAEGYTDA
jgi:hypothetical protein